MKKPDAVTVIPRETFREKIWNLPLSDMIEAGRATTAKLNDYGIYTLGELAQCDAQWITKVLGKNGYMLRCYANGTDNSQVMPADFSMPAKSVGHGVTTTADITRCEDAKPLLLELAQDIGKRLTLQNKYATKVCVNARSSILRNREWQTELPTATRSPMIIADTAYRLFCDNYDWVNPVRSLTVTAFSLVDGGAVIQNSFFNDTIRLEKMEKADGCIRDIRKRFGEGMIKNAVLLTGLAVPKSKAVVSLPGNMLNK